MNMKCCEKCNINTASFAYRNGREPDNTGCLNRDCPCHKADAIKLAEHLVSMLDESEIPSQDELEAVSRDHIFMAGYSYGIQRMVEELTKLYKFA